MSAKESKRLLRRITDALRSSTKVEVQENEEFSSGGTEHTLSLRVTREVKQEPKAMGFAAGVKS